MSVQGTILVLDGTSTNRIMLKVQLTAAWYHVVQGEKLDGLGALLRRTQPDLVLTALTLPDGTAADVKRLIAADARLSDIPVVAIAPQNDKTARLQALSDGLDDVLAHPFKDTLLLARVRSLLRIRADAQDLQTSSGTRNLGFAEQASAFVASMPASRVAMLTLAPATGALWRKALTPYSRHAVSAYSVVNFRGLLSDPGPDAIVVEVSKGSDSLQILADLKSRSATRNTVLIVVMEGVDTSLASDALDLGADAVCTGGFCAAETALRLDHLITRKRRLDQIRASVRLDVAEARIDPLTGLPNRRFAMQALEEMARQSRNSGNGFAVMLADLDHFKTINDRFGHAGGDLVLTEAANQMRATVGSEGFVARVGGEEFLIGLPNTLRARADNLANQICEDICRRPFLLPDGTGRVSVTVSIGLIASDSTWSHAHPDFRSIENLLRYADTALYSAKHSGRNQVRNWAA